MEHVVETVKIVALCVVAAVVYGVLHDQVTARVCLEYFTVAHHHDPTAIALYWGVVATWWVGLPLGIGLSIASRVGSRTPASARDVLPRVGGLLAGLFVLAMSMGTLGYLLAELWDIGLGERGELIPSEHHHAFTFDVWAHGTSYVGGVIGGVWASVATFRWRAREGRTRVAERRYRLASFGCVSLVVAPLLFACTWLMMFDYDEEWSSLTHPRPYDYRDMGPFWYALYLVWPWLSLLLGLAGAAALFVAGSIGETKLQPKGPDPV